MKFKKDSHALGLVEKVNRIIDAQLTIYCKEEDNSDWPQNLPLIQRNINSSINRLVGIYPYELLYGFQPRFVDHELAMVAPGPTRHDPNEVCVVARIDLIPSQFDMKKTFDRRHCPGQHLDIGQIVFAKAPPLSITEH